MGTWIPGITKNLLELPLSHKKFFIQAAIVMDILFHCIIHYGLRHSLSMLLFLTVLRFKPHTSQHALIICKSVSKHFSFNRKQVNLRCIAACLKNDANCNVGKRFHLFLSLNSSILQAVTRPQNCVFPSHKCVHNLYFRRALTVRKESL